MVIDYILVIIALAWLSFASIHDIKKREVPDWLNYSLIIIAFGLRVIHSIVFKEFTFFLHGLIGFVILFILANILYYAKQWGGGDSKLLMGMGIVFATYPESLLKFFNPNLDIPFLIIIVINIFIVGSIYGIFWSVGLTVKNYKEVFKELKKQKSLNRSLLIFAVIMAILSFLFFNTLNKIIIIALIAFILILTYLTAFIKSVEKVTMVKEIPTNKLTEGDWIVKPVYSHNRLIYSTKDPGISKKQIDLLKKYGIKSVTIKEGIPFVPSFLLGVLTSLVIGNVITILFI